MTNYLESRIWAQVLVFALLCLPIPQLQAARDVGEQRECATCHIMWLKDFKRGEVDTLVPYDPKPAEKTGKADVAATRKMCLSCHDGFVLDSRSVWKKGGHSHPVGIKPSKKITIPRSREGKVIFPLNEDGNVYCGTCHTAHGVDWDQSVSPVFMRVKNENSSLCLACHLEQSTGPEEGNHPVFKKMKQVPQSLRAAGAHFGRNNTVICESCHVPHNAPEKKILVRENEKSRLCSACHGDKGKVVGTKHDMSMMAPDIKNQKGVTARDSGPCGACHTPHGARGPALWARERIADVDSSAASCLGCHNEHGPGKEKTIGVHSHPVGESISELGIRVDNTGAWHARQVDDTGKTKEADLPALPLYLGDGNRSTGNGSVGCGSCHDPHNWSAIPDHKESDVPVHKQEGNARTSFLRVAEDGKSALCIRCHHEQVAILDTDHDIEVKQKADRPVGVCGSCHQPHNAKSDRLWTMDAGKEAGFTGKLCTSCHRKDGMAEDKQTGKHSHPVNVMFVEGKELGLPLYPLTAGHSDRLALDCGTCHDPHRWSSPAQERSQKLKRKGKPAKGQEGDDSNSFLRLAGGEQGTLCLTCHKDKAGIARTDHDVNISKSIAEAGDKALGNSLCGSCHSIHNARDARVIWARSVDKKSAGLDGLCRSCHRPQGSAAAKVPKRDTHPEQIPVWSQGLRMQFRDKAGPDMPVYDAHGKPDERGRIGCVSCHDPHKWSANPAIKAPGKKSEGDARNSFLRAGSTANFVCADCHGRDAIFRYKYFHSERAGKHPLYR